MAPASSTLSHAARCWPLIAGTDVRAGSNGAVGKQCLAVLQPLVPLVLAEQPTIASGIAVGNAVGDLELRCNLGIQSQETGPRKRPTADVLPQTAYRSGAATCQRVLTGIRLDVLQQWRCGRQLAWDVVVYIVGVLHNDARRTDSRQTTDSISQP
jgi:hypothetical protein